MIDHERALFVHTLRELYHLEAELENLQAELATEATREELEEYYMAHGETTSEQLARLDALFDEIEGDLEAQLESGVEPGPIEDGPLEALRADRDELVGDIQDPMLADVVDAELGRTIERLELSRLETLLTLADRMDLPSEIVDPLEQTYREAESGLEELQGLPQ
ncbi:hypothetical protein B1756_05360 [Natrarchaeobaculum aegyptiacum]|uniref:Uncharacterized protein n=2 Tax=Natrarchaeobaculum aegyptiacum TaxID=745377 RepID=A0A2Z2HZ26_9EURY|nr:hypothetical protein B1756_05360 [Natrarchaeobaculum aegyptiacum]